MVNSFQNIAVTSFPEFVESEFKPIEKKYLNVIIIHVFIFFFISIFGVFIVDYTKIIDISAILLDVYFSILIIFALIFLMQFLGFKKRKYVVREKDISYKSGLVFKKTTTVPFNRIQHLEIDQGPISRFFDLAVLSVFTAGNSSDDLKINGLKKEEAEKIKEFISNQIDG
ncbi:MAG: PH domain-containing protein [Polaribacter sp.]|nr:PH domain-containing protein [Polaribacter sp.]